MHGTNIPHEASQQYGLHGSDHFRDTCHRGCTACISTPGNISSSSRAGRCPDGEDPQHSMYITQQAGQACLASENPTPLPPASSSSRSANHSPIASSSWQEACEPCLKPPPGARDPSCQVAAACRAVSAAATRPGLPGDSSIARAARRFWHLASRTWGCCSSCTRMGSESHKPYKQLSHALLHQALHIDSHVHGATLLLRSTPRRIILPGTRRCISTYHAMTACIRTARTRMMELMSITPPNNIYMPLGAASVAQMAGKL